jgi:hypothetical protein
MASSFLQKNRLLLGVWLGLGLLFAAFAAGIIPGAVYVSYRGYKELYEQPPANAQGPAFWKRQQSVFSEQDLAEAHNLLQLQVNADINLAGD